MDNDSFSYTRAVDDPVYHCQEPNIRDLYPVRFGFSPKHLHKFSFEDSPNIGRRRTMDSFDFELRKLRQGYVFIYTESEIRPRKYRTDPTTGNWMLFWYETNIADENSNFLQTSAHDFLGSFQEQTFTRLLWPDNDPAEPWELAKQSSFKTIKIPQHITKIEVAYSEEPWPADFFKQCEEDPAFRAQLMMPVNLSPDLTDISCPISVIDEFVEEFKPEAPRKLEEYQVSHTGFNPQLKSVFGLKDSQQLDGRVIALPDPVGELLEIERQVINTNSTRMKHNADYLYPLATAECIQAVNSSINSTRNKLQNKVLFYDLPTQHDELRRQLLSENDALSTNLRRLVSNHQAIVLLDAPFEALPLLKQMLNGITQVDSNSALRRLELASRLFVRLFMNIGDASEGSNALLSLLDPDEGSEISKLFQKLMISWASVSKSLLDANLEKLHVLDVVFEVTAKELGVLGTAKIESLGVKQAISKLHNIIPLGRQPMSVSDLSELIKSGKLPPVSSGGKAITDFEKFARSKVYAGTVEVTPKLPEKDTIEVQHFLVDGQVRPGAHFKQVSQSQRAQRGFGVGLSLLINSWTFFDLASLQEEPGYAETWFGRVSQSTRLNIGLALVAIISDIEKLTQFSLNYVDDLAADTMRSGGANNLFKNIEGKLFNRSSIKAISTGQTGIAQRVTSTVKTAGKVAGWGAVVVSAFNAFEANANKQYIKQNLLVTQALAGGVMLLNFSNPVTFASGAILAIAMAAEYIFSRDKFTAWAERGFWGTSDEYWGVDRLDNIDDQYIKAKQITQENSPLRHYFEEEMHHFERLVYQVNAKLTGYQSSKIELYLPRLSQGNFTLRTKILVKYQAHEIGELKFFTKEIDKTVLYLNGYPITTQLADEKAIIDINQQLLDKAPEQPGYIQYISLHYEYTDPTGHFTSDESRVYNDDRPHTKEPLAQRWWYKMPKLT